jgi:hypothetical protein
MTTRRIESFLLRLVVEGHDDAAAEAWRGRIHHVGSGHERHFERLQDIITFVNEQFGPGNLLWLPEDEPASDE